jgi:hypothetical protein
MAGAARAAKGEKMKSALAPRCTVDQLNEWADAKFIEAATLPKGAQRDELLAEAQYLADRARLRLWDTPTSYDDGKCR